MYRFGFQKVSLLFFVLVYLASNLPTAHAQVSVTTYRYDNGRTGQNINEAILNSSNVNAQSFGALFTYTLDSNNNDSYVYAQPLYLPNVNIPGVGLRNVLYVATEHDKVYAFDADGLTDQSCTSGGVTYPSCYWVADLAGSVGGTTITTSEATNDSYIAPTLGVTSTPVIDSTTGTMYVVANTLENGNRVQRLHALDVTTGTEKFGGSVVIQGLVPGATFDPSIQNQRPALLLANGNVYIGWGAYGDNGDYHGWVMAYNAGTLNQVAVFCTTPNGSAGSNWMLGSLASDQEGNIYTVSGNGTVDGNGDHGESVMKLTSTLGLTDGFTDPNWNNLNANDWDLASGGLLQLPDQPGSAPHLAVVAGKEGTLYLLNRDNLGQFDTSASHSVQQFFQLFRSSPCNVDGECNFGTPAYWNNNVYFAAANHPLQIYQLSNGLFASSNPSSSGSQELGTARGASPMVSANGTSNGIVWALRVDDASATGGPAILYAYDATNAANELYDSNQNSSRDSPGQGQFFSVPVVANGKVYVAGRNQVTVYGLLSSTSAQPPTVQLAANPTSGTVPLTVTASTSGSDPNSGGSIVSSWIDFGDGTKVNASSSSHTYSSPGTYTVIATVYDNFGKSALASTSVSVSQGGGSNCSAAANTVHICLPVNASSVSSPTEISGAANLPGFSSMELYLDDQPVMHIFQTSFDTTMTLSPGSHHAVLVGYSSNPDTTDSSAFTVSTTGGGGSCSAAVNTVHICLPVNGSTVNSPVEIAGAANLPGYTSMQLYIDNQPVLHTPATSFDQSFTLSAAQHFAVLVGYSSNPDATDSTSLSVGTSSGGGGSCAMPSTSPSINICTPAEGTTTSGQVEVTAQARWDGDTINNMRIYVDNQPMGDFGSPPKGFLDQTLTLPSGPHQLVIVMWDTAGNVASSSTRSFSVQ